MLPLCLSLFVFAVVLVFVYRQVLRVVVMSSNVTMSVILCRVCAAVFVNLIC